MKAPVLVAKARHDAQVRLKPDESHAWLSRTRRDRIMVQ
jgi:hypothetical protein